MIKTKEEALDYLAHTDFPRYFVSINGNGYALIDLLIERGWEVQFVTTSVAGTKTGNQTTHHYHLRNMGKDSK